MSQHHTQNEAILDQFTKQAEPYAKLTTSLPRAGEGASPLLDAIGPLPTDTVLDVACGAGSLTLMLAARVRHATGIDLTAAMIGQARAQQAKAGVANVGWLVGDVLPLPFPDGAFSLVVSQSAFHHLADPGAVLAEMARVCARGGRIAINDLGPDPATADAFNRAEKLRDPSHVRALPPAELRALGRKLGLEEIATSSRLTQKFPLEAILATSFPEPGDMDRVRALYGADAESGANTLGLNAVFEDDRIMIRYPMTVVAWRHAGIAG